MSKFNFKNEEDFTEVKSKTEKLYKEVTYYEFIAIMDDVRIKVVIKEVVDGEKYFLSVIPFWGINKTTGRRILASNLKFD